MILSPGSAEQIYFTSRAEAVSGEELILTIDEVVDRLDLEPLYACWSEGGRGFYNPAMMLKILFFAYCDGERYSRRIVKRIKYDIRYQYFTGNLRPGYRTICRFRIIDVDLLASYFVQIVALCEELGLVDISLVAIDGTKIKASASRRRTYKKRDLDRLAAKYREMLQQDSVADLADLGDDDDGGEEASDSGHETVDRNALKRRVGEAMRRLEGGEKEVNLTDGDAKLMKISGGGIYPGYNGQIAVDNNQIIVAADISARANDVDNFKGMVEQTKENISDKAGKYLADGGYYTRSNLKYAVEEGLDIYIPPTNGRQKSEDKYSREDFIYDNQIDGFHCPAGEILSYRGSRNQDDISVKVYRCSSTKCKVCKLKHQCTTDRRRELNISEVYHQEQVLAEKLSSQSGRAIYSRRQAIVEPVFGNIKFNMGFNRFSLRGLRKVKIEFLLMCIAHNLKKMAARWGRLKAAAEGSLAILAQKTLPILNILTKIVVSRVMPKLKLDYA
jgi:transposase